MAEFGSSLESEAISSLTELAALSRILAVVKHGELPAFSALSFLRRVYIAVSFFLFVCLFVSRLLAGKAKAALKGAATSVLQQLHRRASTPADGSHIQRWAPTWVNLSV